MPAQTPDSGRNLEPGAPIERELKSGETHTYRVPMASGQFLHLIVQEKGIAVATAVFDPAGKQILLREHAEGPQGREPISFIAPTSGAFRFELKPIDPADRPGRYEILLRELHPATAQDRTRIAAEEAFSEGKKFQTTDSRESFQSALKKYREALPLWRDAGSREWEARTLVSMGDAHISLNELTVAREPLSEAVKIWADLGDASQEAGALNKICIVYMMVSEFLKGLEYCQQALPKAEQAGPRSLVASLVNNIAAAYWESGQRRKAQPFEERAVELARTEADDTNQAIVLNNVGVSRRTLGEYHRALDYFRQSLKLSQGQRRRAGTLDNIGETYRYLNDYPKALEYHNQALAMWREAADQRGQAQCLNGLGLVYRSMGEYQKALDHFREALPLNRAVKNRRMEANTIANTGIVQYEMRDFPRAIEQLTQAVGLQRELGDASGQSVALVYLGRAWSRSGDKSKALESFQQALSLARKVEHREYEAGALFVTAELARERGDLREARVRVEEALRIYDDLRSRIVGSDLRASYFSQAQKPFDLYVNVLMEQHRADPAAGHQATALEALERARARSLLDTLAEARVDLREGVDPALLERLQDLQGRIDSVAARRTRLLAGKPSGPEAAKAGDELNTLLAEFQEVRSRMRSASPRYAALTQPQPLTVAQIQRQVLDADSLLLAYALGEERSYLWAVTPHAVSSFELPKRGEIEEQSRRFVKLLTERNERPDGEPAADWRARLAKAEGQIPEAAATLGRILLGPVAEQLAGKRLLIVGGGALQYVPFGALTVPGDPAPLMTRNEIASLPSASTLAVLRSEQARRQAPSGLVAVLADPVFDGDDSRLSPGRRPSPAPAVARGAEESETEWDRAARSAGVSRLPRLLFSREEARGILSLAKPAERLSALDFEANRGLVMSGKLAGYRIVHIASHGFANSEHPELSGLVLSQVNPQGQRQDGFLRLHHIYNLRLPVDLVVLSACQTALGREVKGEGLVGLARGFMYAGAPRVIASLWKVDDQATAELMKVFYQGMLGRDRLSPSAALRAAQAALWKQPRWQSPYYWAAFVLQGEWK